MPPGRDRDAARAEARASAQRWSVGGREEAIGPGGRFTGPGREPGRGLGERGRDDHRREPRGPDRCGGGLAGADAFARVSRRLRICRRATRRPVMLVATGPGGLRRPRRLVGAGMARLHECPAHPRRRQEQEEGHEP